MLGLGQWVLTIACSSTTPTTGWKEYAPKMTKRSPNAILGLKLYGVVVLDHSKTPTVYTDPQQLAKLGSLGTFFMQTYKHVRPAHIYIYTQTCYSLLKPRSLIRFKPQAQTQAQALDPQPIPEKDTRNCMIGILALIRRCSNP